MRTNEDIFAETERLFGPLWPYACDKNVTDIDYNGRDLWVRDCSGYKWKADCAIPREWVLRFTQEIANAMSKEINVQNPVLEAETPQWRISIIHESAAVSGRSICIRRTLPEIRITVSSALQEHYADPLALCLLANAVKAHCTVMIGGEPGVGKTELAKFLSQFIPDEERVITIEDSLEWRYREIRPEADCVSLQTSRDFTIEDAITAALRQNPKWLNISEVRGSEVQPYIKNLAAGSHGITTIHVDDVRNIPDRMCHMCDSAAARDRMENDVYSFVNLGILVSQRPDPADASRRIRYIDQICFFERIGKRKYIHMIYDNGMPLLYSLPESILRRFKKEGVDQAWHNEEIAARLAEQGMDLPEVPKDTPDPEFYDDPDPEEPQESAYDISRLFSGA